MSHIRSHLTRHRATTIALVASVCVVLVSWLWAAMALGSQPGPYITNYAEGAILRTGGMGHVHAVGLFGVTVILVNGALALVVEGRDKFLAALLGAATVLISLLIIVYFAAIVSVN